MTIHNQPGAHSQAWAAGQLAYASELTAVMLRLAPLAGTNGLDVVVQELTRPLLHHTPGLKAQARFIRRLNHLRETEVVKRRREAYEAKRGNK